MKRYLSIAILVLAVSSVLVASAHSAELEKPTRAEVVEEVSRFTGLTGDVLGQVYEKNAGLFENVNHAVFAVKAVNMLADAKDQEAAMEVAMHGLDYGLGKLKDKFLPAAMGSFLTLASAYKTALEIVRDHIHIPRFEESIYQTYRSSRAADAKFGDTSEESRETAFAATTMNSASGYYVVKGKMMQEMFKDYNLEAMSDKQKAHLEGKVDDFWIKRLETRYQLGLLKSQKEKLLDETWKIVAKDIEAIRAAAQDAGGKVPENYFPTAKDIPPGWARRLSIYWQKGDFNVNKNDNPGAPSWYQNFALFNVAYLKDKIEKREKDGNVYYLLSNGKDRAEPSDIRFHVSINPLTLWTPDYIESLKRDLEKMPPLFPGFSGPSSQPDFIGPYTEEGVEVGYCRRLMSSDKSTGYECQLLKGGWIVIMNTRSDSVKERSRMQAQAVAVRKGVGGDYYDQTVADENLLRHFVRLIAARIPATASAGK